MRETLGVFSTSVLPRNKGSRSVGDVINRIDGVAPDSRVNGDGRFKQINGRRHWLKSGFGVNTVTVWGAELHNGRYAEFPTLNLQLEFNRSLLFQV